MAQLHIKTAVRRLLRSRRLAIAGALLIGSLALLGWFAPALVVHSPLWPYLLARTGHPLGVQLQAESVSLSWLAPPRVERVTIRDTAGRLLAEIDSLQLRRSLWTLCRHPYQLGTLRVQGFEATVRVRPNGSNLEDLLQTMLAGEGRARPITGTIELVDAQITIEDEQRGEGTRVQLERASVRLSADQAGQADLRGCAVHSASLQGTLQGRLTWQASDEGTSWQAQITADRVPLAGASPWAARWLAHTHVTGQISGAVALSYEAGQNNWHCATERTAVTGLRLACRALADPLLVEELNVRGAVGWSGACWSFDQLSVQCDAGSATLAGELRWPAVDDALAWRQMLKALDGPGIQLDGDLDLSAAARLLPDLLRVRRDTRIDSGNLSVRVSSRSADDGQHLIVRLEARELAASRDGAPVRWDEPLTGTLDARRTGEGWQVEKLACRSAGLELSAAGTAQQGAVTLQCNLDQLTRAVEQFADLSDWRATGQLTGHWQWRRVGDAQLAAEGTGTLRNFLLAVSGRRLCQESNLELSARATAELGDEGIKVVRSGQLLITAEQDRLEASLLDPVPAPGPDSVWPVGMTVRGESDRWLDRIRFLLPPELALEMAGTLELNATCRLARHQLDVVQSLVRCIPWHWRSAGLMIDEPELELRLDGCWQPATGAALVRAASFRCSSVAVNAADLAVDLTSSDPRLVGELAGRGNLKRFYDNWQTPWTPQTWRLLGGVSGQLSLAQHADRAQVRWSAALHDARLLKRSRRRAPAGTTRPASVSRSRSGWRAVWREPQLQCRGTAHYRAAQQAIELENVALQLNEQLELTAAGELRDVWARRQLNLEGRISYDLAQLSRRLREATGLPLHATGRESRTFWVRGPLAAATSAAAPAEARAETANASSSVPSGLSAQGGLGWQSLELLGLATGPGRLDAQLAAGTLHAELRKLPLSQGQLNAVARVDLSAEPVAVQLDRGQLLRDVAITPAMCHRWFKFVAPLAANATRAEGRFSIFLNRGVLPIGPLQGVDGHGVLTLQHGQIGPSPLARQLLGVAGDMRALVQRRAPTGTPLGSSTWLTLPPQEVRLAMRDGRVYHNELTMVVDDLTVHTRGSVGLDQSLSVTARIPIQRAWFADARLAASLANEVIEVPVRGTIDQPQLDHRALASRSKQLLQRVAGRLLLDEVEHGLLQQLFPAAPNQ